ncbi:MAG: cytochrome b [Kordiimonadaceae bacterium]|nr:cytochrome b [Kordiimonadaceae bacterium]MBO6569417.1 cytochrome b [Kordiimonadaceae bacterium]MBO6964892.1 cytochrome b [Kordiimonadaceae bacterium]
MATQNNEASYGWPAKALHWGMALLIISLVALGLYLSGMPRGDAKSELIRLHASSGVLAFMLLLVRFGWKLCQPGPRPLSDIKWQVVLSKLVHWAFYAVIAAQVISGSLSLMTVGWDVPFFGLFAIPTPYERDMALHHYWEGWHVAAWYALASLFALHMGAVLFHQLVGKKRILKRML